MSKLQDPPSALTCPKDLLHTQKMKGREKIKLTQCFKIFIPYLITVLRVTKL